MIKIKTFVNGDEGTLDSRVNEFLTKDIKIKQINSGYHTGYKLITVVYEEGTEGSKWTDPIASNGPQVFETDQFSIREE